MSMEEVSDLEDEVFALRRVIQKAKEYVRLQPLDLLKPHEIQRDLLAILMGEQMEFEYAGTKYVAKKSKAGSWCIAEEQRDENV